MCWGGDPLIKGFAPARTYAEAVGMCDAELRRLCSRAELDAEQTTDKGGCGRQCSDPWDLYWTSDKRPVVTALPPPPAHPAHWLQRGCVYGAAAVANSEKESRWGADDEALGRVECCNDVAKDDTGKTCARRPSVDGVCYGFANDKYVLSTFSEATAMCEATGDRLCTKEETGEVAGACCKTGCDGDVPLTWTSEEKPTKEVNTGKHYLEDGCPLTGHDPVPMFGNDAEKLGEVQCCSVYGGDCRRHNSDKECYVFSDGDKLNPTPSATFAEAEAMCAADGRVLCSREELEAESCCQKGCGHDHALTWTRDTIVTTTTTTTKTDTTITTFANQAVAALLDTDDVYTGDDPDEIPCWAYSDVEVSVSYKEEAGRVSTGDFGQSTIFKSRSIY